jgi:hypothetical protein
MRLNVSNELRIGFFKSLTFAFAAGVFDSLDIVRLVACDALLDLGVENHFASAGRLDLYAGGQLGIATTFGGGKFGNTEVSGAAISSGWSTGSIDPCATTFSLKAFTGANFFVYKKLYVGAEFGVSFSNRSYKDYEVTIDSRTTKKKNDLSKTSFDFFAEPALHLGWVF